MKKKMGVSLIKLLTIKLYYNDTKYLVLPFDNKKDKEIIWKEIT